jgi:hypothetical protein
MAERKSFLLRMDPALWGDLEAWAQDDFRSVNGQIEYLLRQAVLRRKGQAVTNTARSPTDSTSNSEPPGSSRGDIAH